MKPSADLFELVRSLTPSERRYISVHFPSSPTDPPIYVQLYHLLQGQVAYDEAALKVALSKGAPIRQFTRLKNYLFERLLVLLRQFHADRSVHRQCLNALDAVELLYARQMFRAARMQWRKAQRMAQLYELTELGPVLMGWDRKLAKREPSDGREAAEFDQQEARARRQLEHEQGLRGLYDRMLEAGRQRRQQSAADLDRWACHPLLELDAAKLSFTGQNAQDLCRALLRWFHMDLTGSHAHYRSVMERWESHDKVRKAFPDAYLRAAGAFLYSCHAQGNYEEFDTWLARLRADAQLAGLARNRLLLMNYNLRLLYFLNEGPLENGATTAAHLQAEIERGTAPVPSQIPACINLALYHMLREAFDPAYHWLRHILELPDSPAAADLRELARSLQLVVQIERGEMDLLPYQLRSLVRYVQRRRPLNALETALRSLVRSLDRAPQERGPALRRLVADLEAVDLPGASAVRIWAASRLAGLSIPDWRKNQGASAP